MHTLWYFVKEAFRGLWQAKLMTFLSIVTVAISLGIIACGSVAAINAHILFRRASAAVDMAVYLTDAAAGDTGEVARISGRIAAMPQVEKVAPVDRAEAWRRFEAMYGAGMLDAVEENPLPYSFEITLRTGYAGPEAADALAGEVRLIAGVESVTWSPELLSRLEGARLMLMGGTVGLGILCVVILVFMVSNTIRLTIYARRDIIATMSVVGATDRFIRTPFVLEGMLQGGIGALIAVAVLEVLRVATAGIVLSWGGGFLFPALVAAGILFGWLGSAGAVWKFLS